MMILITGATKGIGLSLAHEFAQHGHDLILIARHEALLQSITEELIQRYKVKVIYKVCDLSKSGSASNLHSELKEEGHKINCLVNNAGIGYLGSLSGMAVNTLHDLMHINMISTTELTRLYLNDFVAQNEGKILQVASTAAFTPGPFMALYYASKAYLVSFSQAVSIELKGTPVTISILCPGATRTTFFESAGMTNSGLEKGLAGMMTADQVAKIAYKGVIKGSLFIVPGLINKIFSYLMALTPKSLTAYITSYLHQKPK